MKTVIDAVNEFKGVWPYSNRSAMIYCKVSYAMFKKGSYESFVHDSFSNLNNDNWDSVCTLEEFNQCTNEMSEYKPSNPVYTQAMADNGDLPLVGMECNYETTFFTLPDSNSGTCKILAYHKDKVWLDMGNIERVINIDVLSFKPIEPPIELLDGEPYEFDYSNGNSGMQGAVMRYCKRNDSFFFDNTIFKREYCTNIVLLTPEVKS